MEVSKGKLIDCTFLMQKNNGRQLILTAIVTSYYLNSG